MLSGYRTYLAAAVLFILGGLKALGIIDENTFQTVAALAAAAGLAALRAAVK